MVWQHRGSYLSSYNGLLEDVAMTWQYLQRSSTLADSDHVVMQVRSSAKYYIFDTGYRTNSYLAHYQALL